MLYYDRCHKMMVIMWVVFNMQADTKRGWKCDAFSSSAHTARVASSNGKNRNAFQMWALFRLAPPGHVNHACREREGGREREREREWEWERSWSCRTVWAPRVWRNYSEIVVYKLNKCTFLLDKDITGSIMSYFNEGRQNILWDKIVSQTEAAMESH